MTRAQAREVLWAPIIVWVLLMALLGLTILYAYSPAAPLKTEVALAIGAAKAILIALFFMQLRRAAGLTRLAAAAGLCWASLLYLFSFADFLTR